MSFLSWLIPKTKRDFTLTVLAVIFGFSSAQSGSFLWFCIGYGFGIAVVVSHIFYDMREDSNHEN